MIAVESEEENIKFICTIESLGIKRDIYYKDEHIWIILNNIEY